MQTATNLFEKLTYFQAFHKIFAKWVLDKKLITFFQTLFIIQDSKKSEFAEYFFIEDKI